MFTSVLWHVNVILHLRPRSRGYLYVVWPVAKAKLDKRKSSNLSAYNSLLKVLRLMCDDYRAICDRTHSDRMWLISSDIKVRCAFMPPASKSHDYFPGKPQTGRARWGAVGAQEAYLNLMLFFPPKRQYYFLYLCTATRIYRPQTTFWMLPECMPFAQKTSCAKHTFEPVHDGLEQSSLSGFTTEI